MKRMNRGFSILLILAVILTSMPVGVMAETEAVQTDPVILLEDEVAVISAEGPDAAVEEEPEMDLFDALADQEETELPGITVEPETTLEPEITAEPGKPEESVLIFAYRKGANGTSIDKYTAQFQ